ncbi:uncharacterized protein EAE97_001459 [Botrytis byssoidea]|uniref:Uncharacterized protein n=1 Tax=Botrytis byssoidea TaxID=139641 RepID=A0A9P5IYK0_9HELO|nr:uncharacterized protein EAE97_001459 [Botrytis byssoidea]KAF7954061.1 hypothetical protein EAE97_001459 [Botrytis byssoidea]
MGGGSSMPEVGIGDIFYPDNPKRRARAEQLSNETKWWCATFNEHKKTLDSLEPVVRGRIDAYLKKFGYTTLDDLVSKVNSTLSGDALKEWTTLKTSLSQEHWLDNFLLTISGIVAAGSGIVLGGLVLFSVISGPVGWSVFAGVSAAMGVVALVAGLIDVINGGQEREKLRKAIDDLYSARLQAAQAYRKLEVYNNWVILFSDFFKDEWIELSPEIFEKKFGQGFRNDFYKFNRSTVANELEQHDREVNAWTNEDPAIANISSMMLTAAAMPMVTATMAQGETALPESSYEGTVDVSETSKPEVLSNPIVEGILDVHVTADGGVQNNLRVQLQEVLSTTAFTVLDLDTSELLGVRAEVADSIKPMKTLEDIKFSVTNFSTMETLHNCIFSKQIFAT